MTDNPLNDFILGLATNITHDLLKAGSQYLATSLVGSEEERALSNIYRNAFAFMLLEVVPELDKIHQEHISSLMQEFVKISKNAELLLDIALSKSKPPLQELKAQFYNFGFDPDTIPLDALLKALIVGLDKAASSEAKKQASPLFNRFSVERFNVLLKHLERLVAERQFQTPETRKLSAFISYARADATEFAEWLHKQLNKQDIYSWLDVQDMPSGNSFIDEIDRAIKEADYFLLIFTPGAINSSYCQDEWKKALEHYKPIIPILYKGSYQELPQEANIFLHDAPNFTSQDDYDVALTKLIFQIRRKPYRVGQIHGVPELPRNYLPRKSEVDAVRSQLTAHKTTVLTSISKRIGIQGMGGIGKSVVATALTKDYILRRSFPDGIFWVSFGMEPDISQIWTRLRQWLDGGTSVFSNETEAADYFEKATSNRECLIILDDVWISDHVKAFTRLGDGSRLLVTSRHANILDEIDAYAYELGLLNDQEARLLLAKNAEIEISRLPEASVGILNACGNLPLALAMIGAMVRRKPKTYWDDALEALKDADLEEIAAQFPDYPYPNLFVAIEVSIRALEEDIKEKYYDFAIFSDDVAIPEAVPLTFWKPLSERKTRKKLDELVQRNLLKREEDGSLNIHDLQLAYLRKQAGNLRSRHERLLNNYNLSRKDWHSISDDGYLYDHLVYHLREIQDYPSIKSLFDGPEWFYVRLEQSGFVVNGYLQDLETASHFAYQIISGGAEQHLHILHSLKFALIRTTITSLASNYISALIIQAVKTGYWTEQRAVSIAGIGNLTSVLTELLKEDLIPQDRRKFVATIALETTRHHQTSAYNSSNYSFVKLFPQLPEDLILKAFEVLWDANNLGTKLNTLKEIKVYIPSKYTSLLRDQISKTFEKEDQDRFFQIIDQADITDFDTNQDDLITELGSVDEVIKLHLERPDVEMYMYRLGKYKEQFNTDHIQQLVNHALETDISWLPFALLSIAAGKMNQVQIELIINKAIDKGTIGKPSGWHNPLFKEFTHLFTFQQIQKTLHIILENTNAHYSFEELVYLLPRLDHEQLLMVYDFSQKVSDPFQKSRILSELVVLGNGKIATVNETITVAREIEERDNRNSVYARVAPYIFDKNLFEILFAEASTNLGDEIIIGSTLAQLLRRIQEPGTERIDIVFKQFVNTLSSEVLQPIVYILSLEQITEIVKICENSKSNITREILPLLVPFAKEGLHVKLFDLILQVDDANYKAEILGFLASYVPESAKEAVVNEAIIQLDKMTDMSLYGIAVANLAKHIGSSNYDRFLDKHLNYMLSVDTSDKFRARSLINILPHLRGDIKHHTYLNLFEFIRQESFDRKLLIEEIAAYLDNEWLVPLIDLISDNDREWAVSRDLNTLAASTRRTDAEKKMLANKAYQKALNIKLPWGRIIELSRSALYLDDEDKNHAIQLGIESALSFSGNYKRIEGLLYYSRFSQNRPDYLNILTKEMNTYLYHEAQYSSRRELLEFIGKISKLFGSNTAKIVFDDMILVCRNWDFG